MVDKEEFFDFLGFEYIEENKNYWLVRTQAGDYYQEFYLDHYIAIGWDEISDLDEIKCSTNEQLKEKILSKYEDEKRPGHVANQILRFVKDMKTGDIVIIPSKGSTHICIGEIIDDAAYIFNPEEIEDFDEEMCPFLKRRKVKWIKTIRRDKLDPYLYRLLNSHHTITDAKEYEDFIDRSLYSFYRKGDVGHAVFEVQAEYKINALDLINLINNIISTVDEFNGITEFNLKKEDIDIKINVQSPGPVEFLGDITTILAIGITTVAIVGGGFKFIKTKDSFEGEISSNGLIEGIVKLIDAVSNKQLQNKELDQKINESMIKLNVKLPEINTNDDCDKDKV